jgi:uncharacterized protein YecT (DUF1311 family)
MRLTYLIVVPNNNPASNIVPVSPPSTEYVTVCNKANSSATEQVCYLELIADRNQRLQEQQLQREKDIEEGRQVFYNLFTSPALWLIVLLAIIWKICRHVALKNEQKAWEKYRLKNPATRGIPGPSLSLNDAASQYMQERLGPFTKYHDKE